MNRRESAIIGAYTGIQAGPFSALHEYLEEIMGRSVYTHELVNEELWAEIKQRSKDDFIALTKSISSTEDK